MINVYVAGASRNKERARAFMDRVRAHEGMTLAYDWVADIDAADELGQRDEDFDNTARLVFAGKDLDNLADADVAVFLFELEPVGRGSYVELGYAMAVREACELQPQRPQIIVSGGGKRSIFTVPGLVDVEVSELDDAHTDELTLPELTAACDELAWRELVGRTTDIDELVIPELASAYEPSS